VYERYQQQDKSSEFSLVIVGAGPNGTYALERLAAELTAEPPDNPLAIHVFEKSGHFGAGWVHSPSQPKSSMLNRIVGQITFACDETNTKARHLLDKQYRPTFFEWCQNKYKLGGDEFFNMQAEDWPPRYIHGLALIDQFRTYCDLLNKIPGVSVHLYDSEVVGVELVAGRYQITSAKKSIPRIFGDHLLFVTGHSTNQPSAGSYVEKITQFAKQSDFYYAPFAYPLKHYVKPEYTDKDHVVGCVGLGLTAIDVFLYLTEGRGGKFLLNDDGRTYTYQASGNEPKKIVGISQSGLFTSARPFNAKEQDLEKYEHKGIYLTPSSVDQIRRNLGIPTVGRDAKAIKQIDFEKHLFPIVYLEMAVIHYKVLFGEDFAKQLSETLSVPFQTYLLGELDVYQSLADGVNYFVTHLNELVKKVFVIVEQFVSGTPVRKIQQLNEALNVNALLSCYFETLLGIEQADEISRILLSNLPTEISQWSASLVSPLGHEIDVKQHYFSWEKLITPIPCHAYKGSKDYPRMLLEYMEYDQLQASQGNLLNPSKAACDGVWRDLRQVFALAADFGGFTAQSHKVFITRYMRYHNRLANGACIEVMEKMTALIRAKILDVSVGPMPNIEESIEDGKIWLVGTETEHKVKVDSLIDARLHELNVRLDRMPLYKQLYNKGLIKAWVYPSAKDNEYIPGGIELTKDFHPIDQSGFINRKLTFLGPASEGVMFFQVGAARPYQNHHVLNDIIDWSEEFLTQMAATNQCMILESV
jgi:uncharacterized NAD(P)/FAD-binding protein YdhS